MYKVTSRWGHQNFIKVEWNLGKRCNYDCSYCPSSIHDNTSPHTDIEILKATVDKLMAIGRPIRLSFTGGEPCVHPQFQELIRYCIHTGVSWISVTTNGTLPKGFYEKLPVQQIVFSLHFEYDWNRVLDTITHVYERQNTNVVVHVMAHQDHMTNVRRTVGYLKEYDIPFAVRRVRWTNGDHDLFDDMRYHPDDLEWVKEQDATVKPNTLVSYPGDTEPVIKYIHANDIIKLNKNQYKGWTCNIGLESLMINWDGEVHRATCRVGGSLGNIYNNTFNLPILPVICDRNFCTCAADIPITKYANKSNQPT